MKTDVIMISSGGDNMENALVQIDKLCEYKDLSRNDALSLRLLTEETLAMMRAITGDVNGEFWVEEEDGVYELHLLVRSLVDSKMKEQLLSASASGKNEATRGFMGKIRSFFEPSYSTPMFTAGYVGGNPVAMEHCSWSMDDYRDQLRQYRELNERDKEQEWDELEKSVVARVADDVKVSIRGNSVEMIIVKRIA